MKALLLVLLCSVCFAERDYFEINCSASDTLWGQITNIRDVSEEYKAVSFTYNYVHSSRVTLVIGGCWLDRTLNTAEGFLSDRLWRYRTQFVWNVGIRFYGKERKVRQ